MTLASSFSKLAAALQDSSLDYPDQRPLANLEILVLWVTQSGTAQGYAERLTEYLSDENRGAKVICKSVSHTSIDELSIASYVVIIAATYDGLPAEGELFFEELYSIDTTLQKGLKYAILGLENSSYVDYNVVGKRIDQRLHDLGGKRLLQLTLADDEDEQGSEAVYIGWERSLLYELYREFGHIELENDQSVAEEQIEKKTQQLYCDLVANFFDHLQPTYTDIDEYTLAGTFNEVLGNREWIDLRRKTVTEAWAMMDIETAFDQLIDIPIVLNWDEMFNRNWKYGDKLCDMRRKIRRKQVFDAVDRWIDRHNIGMGETFKDKVQQWWLIYLGHWVEAATSPGRIGKYLGRYLSHDGNTNVNILRCLISAMSDGPPQTVTLSYSGYEGAFCDAFIDALKLCDGVEGVNVTILLPSPPKIPSSTLWKCIELSDTYNITWINESIAQVVIKPLYPSYKRIDMAISNGVPLLEGVLPNLYTIHSDDVVAAQRALSIAHDALELDNLLPLQHNYHEVVFPSLVRVSNYSESSVHGVVVDMAEQNGRQAVTAAGVYGPYHLEDPPYAVCCTVKIPRSETTMRMCGDVMALIREQFVNGVLSMKIVVDQSVVAKTPTRPAAKPVAVTEPRRVGKGGTTEFDKLLSGLL